MIVEELVTELRSIFSDEQIKTNVNMNHPLGNSGVLTVYPKTEEEIVNVLKYANENKKTVTVEGGGTKRGYGGLIETTDILFSLEKYKGIVEHTVGDMTLTVKAGTTFKEIQDYLAKHHQKISLDPFLPEHATIGGVIAANDSGPKRLGYGSARDAVIGLRMIYPDGTVIRSGGKVVKNVAGYDMNKLFIGSMGTLGVISEVTVKLRPVPKHESLIHLSFPDGNLEEIRAFSARLLDSMMEPVTLELLCPSLSETLTGEKSYSLAISFEDVENSVRYQEEFVKKNQPPGSKLKIFSNEEATVIWEKFYSIVPNGAFNSENMLTEARLKIGVVNLDVLKIVREAHLLQDSHNLFVEAHGSLGNGLCQVIFRGSGEDILDSITILREKATQLGGYAVVKHLPLSLREKANVWGDKPAYFFLHEGIKAKIDPNKILNPKRFIGGI